MSNPKLPPDWRRFASRPGMVTPATRLMDADRVRDRKSLFDNFPNLEAAVGNGWEIVAHLVSETKGEGHSLLTTFRLDLYGDGMLLRSVPHRDLQTAQTMAKGIASAIPTAFVVAGSGDFSSASFDDVPASELLAAPVDEMRWHVPGLVPSGLPTLLGGDGGTGKSLAALQLAFATVMGLPWLGHHVQQGGCIFLTAEDDQGEIRRRLAAIAARSGVGQGDPHLAGLRINARVGEDALLGVLNSETRAVEPTPFFHALERSIERHRPALVVLDTLADLFGGDENVRSQARQFVGLLRRLSSLCGTAVLCLSHPSLAGMNSGTGTSGSTGWSNSVRSRLYLERVFEYRRKGNATQAFEPDPDARVLTIKKTNHAQAGATTRIRWVNGVLEVDGRAPALSALTSEEASAKVDDLFISLLAALSAEGRNPGPLPSSSYAPALFAKDDRSGKVTKAAFAKAMSRLLAERRIVVVEAKRGSKRLEIAQPDYANPPADAGAD